LIKQKYLWLSVILLFFCGACSLKTVVIREVTDIAENGIISMEQDDDLEMVKSAFPSNIKLLEAMLVDRPNDYRLLTLISRYYASYTFIFIEPELEETTLLIKSSENKAEAANLNKQKDLKHQLNKYYLKSAEFALKALESRHPGCRNKLKKINETDAFLKTLALKDVPALFWYGFSVGSYANANLGSVRAVSKAAVSEKAIKRVVELESNYFHSGAHLFLMAYYGSRSKALGGNPEKANGHYQKIKQIEGDSFLLPNFYYAKYYLTQIQDRKQYIKMLTEIIKKKRLPEEHTLLNTVAQKRAKAHLDAVDNFFE